MVSSKLLQCMLASALVLSGVVAQAQTNVLKQSHERSLAAARAYVPENPAMKAEMLIDQAAALDNLGQSEQALLLTEQALSLATPDQQISFNVTKGTILFSMGRAPQALLLLAPLLESERHKVAAFAPVKRAIAMSEYQSGFIIATFSCIEQADWKGALAYLADAESTPDDSTFRQYRALVYRYIMARANDAALANQNLEKQAAYFAETSKSHYGALLRMWQGANNLPELSQALSVKSGEEQADAKAESLFYMGAYAKFIKHDEAAARNALDQLNQMAPYGSLEWVHGRRTLTL